MEKRTIADVEVSAMGLGCMGMSWAYGSPNDNESLRTLERALELGVFFWDTADLYGAGENEKLLSRVLKTRRREVFLATKFGNVIDKTLTSHQDLVAEDAPWIVDGTPRYVRACCEQSLKRLGVEEIDLYYQHRIDPRVPVEDTVGEMKRLVEEGKVRYLGLSEAAAGTIRRAAKVHPIAALQSEYSLWTRDPEPEVLPTCRELGIALVAYSPLGRGFLTGAIKSPEDLETQDYRRKTPRFMGENFEKNLALVDTVRRVAAAKGVTPAQVAIAWVLSRGKDVIPIPGTKRVKYLEENVKALEVDLSESDRAELDGLRATGPRYPEHMLKYVGL